MKRSHNILMMSQKDKNNHYVHACTVRISLQYGNYLITLYYYCCTRNVLLLYCILHCIVLYYIVLCCIVLHCIVLYCIVLYCIVLYGIVLYCVVLCCIVLCCIVMSCGVFLMKQLLHNSILLINMQLVHIFPFSLSTQ